MAVVKFDYDGYGQVELNNVAFRRDGRIEAQCALDEAFTTEAPAENGMLLAVDKANRLVKLPTATETLPIALHYSTEHLYDERTPGLKSFKLTRSDGTYTMKNAKDAPYPRMGYLAVGDLFTTNTVCFDDTETGFTAVTAVADDPSTATVDETVAAQTKYEHFLETLKNGYKQTTYYGGIDTSGRIKVTATAAPTYGPTLKVVEVYTMPDGTPGFKFQVIKA